jgi:uncharacterized repeat protein (TIGR04138 family)
MPNAERSFWDAVDTLRERDPRYRREAYGFVMVALADAAQSLPEWRKADPAHRHLTGGELLLSVIAVARREFGNMAPMVFQEWGVRRGADVGEIVFELVDAAQLTARPEDRREDFTGGPDLMTSLAAGGPWQRDRERDRGSGAPGR